MTDLHIDRLSILRAALREWAWWHVTCHGYPGVSSSTYRQPGGVSFQVRLPRGVNVPLHILQVMRAFGQLDKVAECRQPLGTVRAWYLRDRNRKADDVAAELGMSPGSFHALRKQGELILLSTIAYSSE